MISTFLRSTPIPEPPRPERLPLALVALSLATPAIDLVARLQHLSTIEEVGTGLAVVTALLVGLFAIRGHGPGWMLGATFAFGAGAVLRLLGAEQGQLLTLLGIVALGASGSMAEDSSMLRTDVTEPITLFEPQADRQSEPTRLAPAA